MRHQERPGDYRIASGETHSVRKFCDAVFRYAGLDWEDHVEYDPQYGWPAVVENLLRDPTKAAWELGWKPFVDFDGLVRK